MAAHEFRVMVEAQSQDEAERVMVERIDHDEDYGFEYRVSWGALGRRGPGSSGDEGRGAGVLGATSAHQDAIYRTVFSVEVFSRGPFEACCRDVDPVGLGAINEALIAGDCLGDVREVSCAVVPAVRVAAELRRIGNDGTFFDDDVFAGDGDEASAPAVAEAGE